MIKKISLAAAITLGVVALMLMAAPAGATLTLGSTSVSSDGALTVDATSAALNLGTSNASSLSVGKTGVTTTNNGAMTVTQVLTATGESLLSGGARISLVNATTTNADYLRVVDGRSTTINATTTNVDTLKVLTESRNVLLHATSTDIDTLTFATSLKGTTIPMATTVTRPLDFRSTPTNTSYLDKELLYVRADLDTTKDETIGSSDGFTVAMFRGYVGASQGGAIIEGLRAGVNLDDTSVIVSDGAGAGYIAGARITTYVPATSNAKTNKGLIVAPRDNSALAAIAGSQYIGEQIYLMQTVAKSESWGLDIYTESSSANLNAAINIRNGGSEKYGYGIDMNDASTPVTADIRFSNGDTLSNSTAGTIKFSGIASSTSITLLNGETITNATDGTIDFGTANLTATGNVSLTNGALVYGDTGTATACASSAATLNLSTGNFFTLDMAGDADCAITFSNGTAGGIYVIELQWAGVHDFTLATATYQSETIKQTCDAVGATANADTDKATITVMARTASAVQILSCAPNIVSD